MLRTSTSASRSVPGDVGDRVGHRQGAVLLEEVLGRDDLGLDAQSLLEGATAVLAQRRITLCPQNRRRPRSLPQALDVEALLLLSELEAANDLAERAPTPFAVQK